MFLARRNLLQDSTRLALSIAGVALAVMLILLLNGFLDGMYRQIAAYLEHTPGSVIVAQEDITNLLGATSLLPPGTAAAARGCGATVAPILSQFVVLDLHDKKQPVYLVGYDVEAQEIRDRAWLMEDRHALEPLIEQEALPLFTCQQRMILAPLPILEPVEPLLQAHAQVECVVEVGFFNQEQHTARRQ